MAMRVNAGIEPIKSPLGIGRGGSRPKPPKAAAQRASLEAPRSMPDHEKPKRRLTDKTVAFYIAEAVMLAVIFAPGLIRNWPFAVAGIAIGAGVFWILVPFFLRRLAMRFPRHEPWMAGQPMPNWARE